MPSFNDLETAAKQAASAQIQKQESWVKSHRGWLIALAVVFALGLIIPHL